MQHKLNCIASLHTPISPVSHGHRARYYRTAVFAWPCVGGIQQHAAYKRTHRHGACAKIGIARGLRVRRPRDTANADLAPLFPKNTTHSPCLSFPLALSPCLSFCPLFRDYASSLRPLPSATFAPSAPRAALRLITLALLSLSLFSHSLSRSVYLAVSFFGSFFPLLFARFCRPGSVPQPRLRRSRFFKLCAFYAGTEGLRCAIAATRDSDKRSGQKSGSRKSLVAARFNSCLRDND